MANSLKLSSNKFLQIESIEGTFKIIKLRKYYEEMVSKEREELKEIARICEI